MLWLDWTFNIKKEYRSLMETEIQDIATIVSLFLTKFIPVLSSSSFNVTLIMLDLSSSIHSLSLCFVSFVINFTKKMKLNTSSLKIKLFVIMLYMKPIIRLCILYIYKSLVCVCVCINICSIIHAYIWILIKEQLLSYLKCC